MIKDVKRSNIRPKYWVRLILERDDHDYQGAPCEDGTVTLLLCRDCHSKAADMLNTLKATPHAD